MNGGWVYRALVLLVVCLIVTTSPNAAPPPSSPSSRTIKVVMDNNYPPFVFLDSEGKLQGILIDQWRLWEQKTGIRAEIHAMDWGKAIRRMEAGEFDVIDTIFFNETRARVYDFSRPYAKLDVPVFFHKNISGITDAESLKGFTVAVKAGDAAIDVLKKHGVDQLLLFDSYEEIIRAARGKKVVVFVVDKPPALYFLYKMGIQDQFKFSPPLYVGEFHRAVLKGNKALLEKVEEGFAHISPRELEAIERRWYGTTPSGMAYLKYLFVAVMAGTVVILVLAAWNRSLRKSVEHKTVELREEMALTAKQSEALRSSEENYRLVVENSNDGIVIAQDGLILFANLRVSEVTGVPTEEINGSPFLNLIHPEDREMVVGYYSRRLQGDQVPNQYEFRALTNTGETIWLENSAVLTTWEGKLATVSFMRDITQQKRLEDQLIQSRKMEAVGKLAGGVAHDFNNLLTAILGYSEILNLRFPAGDPSHMQIEEIQKAAERAAGLTRQLLAFSRKQILQPRVISINSIVSEMDRMLRRLLGEDIDIVTKLDDGLWNVRADPGQIEQVVMNLAVNARDAMTGGGKLTIETANVSLDEEYSRGHLPTQPGPYVMLAVSDTGVGMDEKTMSRVFEPFFTTKELGKGTGLGLSTVYGIVKQSGGYIWAYSEPGRGSTFKVYLPRTEDREDIPHEAVSPVEDFRGEKAVLVVEDDESIRKLAVEILGRYGYSVIYAGDGEEALRIAGAHEGEISLLLTDVVMPRIGGRELYERIRQQRPEIKVLYMSGYTDDAIVHQGVLDPGTAFLQKPYTPISLVRKVKEVLETPG